MHHEAGGHVGEGRVQGGWSVVTQLGDCLLAEPKEADGITT